MNRAALLLACLAIFAACVGPVQEEEEQKYTISGKIIDPEANGRRLLSGIIATVTGTGGVVYSGAVDIADTISCRYTLKDIPAGQYDFLFSGSYYENARYRLDVKGNETLDVELTPVQLLSVDKDILLFESRVQSQQFSIKNISGQDLILLIRTRGDSGRFIQKMTPGSRQEGGWLLNLSAGETRRITVEVFHEQEGVMEGQLELCTVNTQEWKVTALPVRMETTSRDFNANLVGRVCDIQGNPLEGILMFCDCGGLTTLTDENGRYSFDEVSGSSMFRVAAISEYYKFKQSDFIEYVIDELVADMTLEPCTNHLILDRKEIDFGTGSISQADMTKPEEIDINITAETDESVYYNLQVFNTEFGTVPGLNYYPTAQYIENYPQITFTLSRSVSNEGTFKLNAFLKTDNAGAYIIPITFTNTP